MIFISESELYNLQGLPHLCWPVYCHIRRLMDIKTGLAGDRYPISVNSIADDCRVEEGQGKQNTGKPTRSKIRTVLENLIKVGLLESRSIITAEQKKLIFYMPIAFAALCEQNKRRLFNAHKVNTELHADVMPETSMNSVNCDPNSNKLHQDNHTVNLQKRRPYKRINKYINTQTHAREKEFKNESIIDSEAVQKETHQQKTIDSDFKPSAEIIAQAKSKGLSLAENPLTLLEFVMHAKANGKLYDDWDAGFLQWLIRGERLLKPSKTRSRNDAKHTTTNAKGNVSLVEQIQQRNVSSSKNGNVLLFRADNEGGHSNSVDKFDDGIWA